MKTVWKPLNSVFVTSSIYGLAWKKRHFINNISLIHTILSFFKSYKHVFALMQQSNILPSPIHLSSTTEAAAAIMIIIKIIIIIIMIIIIIIIIITKYPKTTATIKTATIILQECWLLLCVMFVNYVNRYIWLCSIQNIFFNKIKWFFKKLFQSSFSFLMKENCISQKHYFYELNESKKIKLKWCRRNLVS